jgi:hypothetical protein
MTDPALLAAQSMTSALPDYTYLLADTVTGAVIDEVPLVGVQWGRVLDGPGEATAQIPMFGLSEARRRQIVDALHEVRTSLYIKRGTQYVWGGVLWSARPDSVGRYIEITANGFLSYFGSRLIPSTLSYSQVDQFTIAEGIVNAVQGVAYGDIGVVVNPSTSGVLRDRTYYDYEKKNALDALLQLSAVINGFDLSIDMGVDSFGTPTRSLVLSYPQRGLTAAQSGLIFELPGNVLSYSYDRDGTGMASSVHAIGAGDGESALRSVASTVSLLAAGYPLTETVTLYPDVSEQTTLDAHAAGDAQAYSAPIATPGVVVTASDPEFGSYDVGDTARLRITDACYPRQASGGVGLDVTVRIVSFKVTVPASGLETVEIVFNPVLVAA